MGNTRGVVHIRARPFAHDRPQSGRILVVVGGAADQNVLAVATVQGVGPQAADEQVAAVAAGKCIVAGATNKNVGTSPAALENIIAIAAVLERGQASNTDGALIVAVAAVEQKQVGCSESSERRAVQDDLDGSGAGTFAYQERVVGAGATHG